MIKEIDYDFQWDDKLDSGFRIQVYALDYDTGDDSVGLGESCTILAFDPTDGEPVELSNDEDNRLIDMALDMYHSKQADYPLAEEFNDEEI